MLAGAKRKKLDSLNLSPLSKPYRATGAFGFVVLAEEIGTNEKWAIKFLERGNKITKVRREREREIACFFCFQHRLLLLSRLSPCSCCCCFFLAKQRDVRADGSLAYKMENQNRP